MLQLRRNAELSVSRLAASLSRGARRQISRSDVLGAEGPKSEIPTRGEQLEKLKADVKHLGDDTVRVSSSVEAANFHVVEGHASDHHGQEGHHDTSHHHNEPINESLGTAFYIFLAALPISIAVYTASHPADNGKIPVLTKLLKRYGDWQEHWDARNTLHTAMVEQAAVDRHLFTSARGGGNVGLRFNEMFNTGSPYNLQAGQQPRGMEELVTYYERKNAEVQERMVARVEAGRI